MTSDFRLDREDLHDLARQRAEQYRSARPFPHLVVNDFLPKAVIDACIAEFPGPDAIQWDVYTDEGNTLKLATSDQSLMGPHTRRVVDEFNGPAILEFLEELTGIGGLLPDPYLTGGGLHQIEPGGFLRVHADFNRHPKFDLDRRINVLLFLNPDWRDEWGGPGAVGQHHDRLRATHPASGQPLRDLQYDRRRLPWTSEAAQLPGGDVEKVAGLLLLLKRATRGGTVARAQHALSDSR
jgi:hypothetical protein